MSAKAEGSGDDGDIEGQGHGVVKVTPSDQQVLQSDCFINIDVVETCGLKSRISHSATTAEIHQDDTLASQLVDKISEIDNVGGIGDAGCQAVWLIAKEKSTRRQGGEIARAEHIGEGVETLLFSVGHVGLRSVFKDDARIIEIPEVTGQAGGGVDVDGGVVQTDRTQASIVERGTYQIDGAISAQSTSVCNSVTIVDEQGIIGDRSLAVWCVPVSGCIQQAITTTTRPGHGLVDAELHGLCGIVIIQAGGIAAGIVNAESILTSVGEGGIRQASDIATKVYKRYILGGAAVARQVGCVGCRDGTA